jgi:hypothetical protein
VAICHSCARRPASYSEKKSNIPNCDCRRASLTGIKQQELQPLSDRSKEVICTTTRTPKGVTFPAYPSLRYTAGAPGEKTQNPKYRGTRD